MAHPLKAEVTKVRSNRNREGVKGHNAKLRRMTENYGAADPAMYQTAQGDLPNGPQDVPEYGAEGDAPLGKGDRARRSTAANPIATYKRGGRVHDRQKAEARAAGGAVPSSGVISRALGGRVRKPASTNINIVVSPSKPADAQGALPVIPPSGMPPVPVGPPPGPPAGPSIAGPMPPPGAIPPGLIPPRKRGGRVHEDAAEDAAEIRRMVKPSALRARGGRMTAGAESGPGRLEKTANRARRQGQDKFAEV